MSLVGFSGPLLRLCLHSQLAVFRFFLLLPRDPLLSRQTGTQSNPTDAATPFLSSADSGGDSSAEAERSLRTTKKGSLEAKTSLAISGEEKKERELVREVVVKKSWIFYSLFIFGPLSLTLSRRPALSAGPVSISVFCALIEKQHSENRTAGGPSDSLPRRFVLAVRVHQIACSLCSGLRSSSAWNRSDFCVVFASLSLSPPLATMAALQPPPPHASSSPSFSPAPASASRCVSSSLVVPQDSRQPRALRLLCWFLCHNEYNDFRFEELEALAEAEGVSKAFLWGGEKARESSPTPKPVSYPPSPLTAANAAAGGGPSCSLSFPPASLLASPLASPSPPPPSMCSSPSAPPLPSPFGSPLLPTSSASSPPPLSSLAPNALPAFSAPPNVLAEASPPTSPVLRVPPSSPCSSPAFSWTVSAPAPAAPLAACRPEEASRKQFVYCHFPSEEAACRILEKSILVRAFIEVSAEETGSPAKTTCLLALQDEINHRLEVDWTFVLAIHVEPQVKLQLIYSFI
ncbi:hypothetical protein TGVAND_436090 [Toxoplasma gondii VAND]|uniref:Uncharacterized protein n=1 Tax=Toxoplasma gondii VAND TaxID=933077 RepID=A0A086Q9W6_TOXGO|nr:hypothetical protein TGVAND_436090 [Toxoplasma gondii VAND]